MPAGRPPVPTSVKVNKGTEDPEALNNEPKYPTASVDAPDYLTGLAKDKWKALAPFLVENNLLTLADIDSFARYCQFYQTYREAVDAVAADGITVQGRSADQQVKHPAFQVMRDSADQMDKLANRFGLTPSDRAKLNTGGSVKDPLAAFLEEHANN